MSQRFVLPSLCFVWFVFSSANVIAQSVAEKSDASIQPTEMFSTDSRRWSRVEEAVVLNDFSKTEPASALVTGKREKGKWKAIPFATADWKG